MDTVTFLYGSIAVIDSWCVYIYTHVACLACDCNGCLKVSYPSSDTNNKKKRCFHIHPDGNHPNENNRNYIFVKCVVKLLEFEFMVYWLHMLILAVSIDICKKIIISIITITVMIQGGASQLRLLVYL